MTTLRIFISILLIGHLSTVQVCGQIHDNFEPFNSSDYSKNKYQIKLDTVSFCKLKIEIRQAKLIDNKTNTPSDFYCRGWLTISRDGKTINQIYFKTIEAVGGCSGLFIPDKQPRNDCFIISKFGDYDGTLFMIDTTGTVTEKLGGVFYISKDKRYLFSSYDSDLSGLTVYELNKKLILFSDTLEPYLAEWYFQDNKYFALVNEDVVSVNAIKIATFDFTSNKIKVTKVDKSYPKTENKLTIFNDYSNAKDCNCGQ